MTGTVNAHTGYNAKCPFSGDNLLLLMGLPADSGVMAIGGRLDSWKALFRNIRFSSHVPEPSAGTESCGLILYHATSAANSLAFGADMKRVRNLLAENGSLLVFAENPTAFRNLRKLKQREFGSFFGELRHGNVPYEKVLRRAGFDDVRRFYPLPSLEQAEELVAAGSRLLELPHYWHPVLHAANKLGFFRILAEGFVFHAGPFRLESGDLVNRINDELSRQSGRHGVHCVLERIDIRSRGALVLFLVEETTGNRLIARIVSDKKNNEIIGKNHEFLKALNNAAGVSETFKNLLPRPLCRMEYADAIVYVETMVNGQPAWKVSRAGIKDTIFQGSITFLQQLNLVTARFKRLQEHDLDGLFNEDLARIMNSDAIDSSFQEKMVHVIHSLSRQMVGLELNLATSHGDYGYGNILVDPHRGSLSGVIDWDTAREDDFPGIDLFNLLIQKERAERGCGPLDAFSAVISDLAAGGLTASLPLFMENEGGRAELSKLALYMCFLRYVTRSLQYPQIFLDEQDEYCSVLARLQDVVPL